MDSNTTTAKPEENLTDGGSTDAYRTCLRFPTPLLIVSQVSSTIIGVLAAYATLSLILHHTLTRRRTRRSVRKCSGSNPEHERRARFYKKMMNLHMILASCWIMVRCVLDFVVIQNGHLSDPNYFTYSKVEILLNIASLSSMYFVLWLRQWSFYSHPVMEDAKLGRFRVLCGSLLAIMIATGIWNAVAFLIDRDNAFTLEENDCIYTNSSTMHKFYVLGACTLFYQFVLLGLFAYPLILHARKNIIADSSKKRSIMRVLKRVFLAAVICSLSDLATSVVSVILEESYPESSFLVYNINIFANFLSLMYSFGDWKVRIMYPFIMCKRTQPPVWNTSTIANSNMSSQT